MSSDRLDWLAHTPMLPLHTRLHVAADAQACPITAALLREAALLHEAQAQALCEAESERDEEQAERLKLETALHAAKGKVSEALNSLIEAWCPPVEFGRDMAPHINLMAGHGDPDYLTKGGMSVRHVDLREVKPSKKSKKGSS